MCRVLDIQTVVAWDFWTINSTKEKSIAHSDRKYTKFLRFQGHEPRVINISPPPNISTAICTLEFMENFVSKKNVQILTTTIGDFIEQKYKPGDSKWPFHPLVGGHLTFERAT